MPRRCDIVVVSRTLTGGMYVLLSSTTVRPGRRVELLAITHPRNVVVVGRSGVRGRWWSCRLRAYALLRSLISVFLVFRLAFHSSCDVSGGTRPKYLQSLNALKISYDFWRFFPSIYR